MYEYNQAFAVILYDSRYYLTIKTLPESLGHCDAPRGYALVHPKNT